MWLYCNSNFLHSVLTGCSCGYLIWFLVSFGLQEYWVMLLNLLFSCLAIFHLTYLGSMFDPGVDEQEVEEVRTSQSANPEGKKECERLLCSVSHLEVRGVFHFIDSSLLEKVLSYWNSAKQTNKQNFRSSGTFNAMVKTSATGLTDPESITPPLVTCTPPSWAIEKTRLHLGSFMVWR